MNTIVPLIKKYPAYLLIFFYGFFYHISSSEFWPITISKTWLSPEIFEYSLLQKPLFGLFLSLFHLLPLSDAQHVYLVKGFFSLIGAISLFYYSRLIAIISGNRNIENSSGFFILIFLISSPVIFNNFFRIRTDQITFLFFVLFILACQINNLRLSIFYLFIIPLIGIKELIFLIPGFYLLFHTYGSRLKRKTKLFTFLIFFTIVVWILALNITSISYFYETLKSQIFPNNFLKTYIQSEWLLILGSLLLSIYYIYKKSLNLTKYAFISLFCALLILVMPQSYPYFIGSLAPFLYLPLLLTLFNSDSNKRIKLTVLLLILINNLLIFKFNRFPDYFSNRQQIEYINMASDIISTNKMNYLDGMGIMPKQNFLPCFVSPDDEVALINCKNLLIEKKADAVILTQRLSSLLTQTTDLSAEYYQVLPNLWIKNSFKNKIPESKINLDSSLIPVFLFNFY